MSNTVLSLRDLRAVFAQRLQIERRQPGITQEMQAERIGRSVDMVSRMERAATSPSFETLALVVSV